jgi:hypothetical protein
MKGLFERATLFYTSAYPLYCYLKTNSLLIRLIEFIIKHQQPYNNEKVNSCINDMLRITSSCSKQSRF